MSHSQSSSALSTFGQLTACKESYTGRTLALTFRVPASGHTESDVINTAQELPNVHEGVRVKLSKDRTRFTVTVPMEISGLSKHQITNRKRETVATLLCRLHKTANGTPTLKIHDNVTPIDDITNKSRRRKPRRRRGRPRPKQLLNPRLRLVQG